jgi:hypothetical protein
MNQFRNFDAPARAQAVTVMWEREECPDDTASPLDWMDEAEDAERIAAWRDGQFTMIGIRAKATLLVPLGQVCFATYELTSCGLWGIESDSGEEYLASVFEEEKAQLVDAIAEMGKAALAHQALA